MLLVREKDVEWWSFPGGGIDYGEAIHTALPRELAEELGVSESELKIEQEIAYIATGAVVNGIPRANVFYRIDIPIDYIRTGNDVLEFGWFAPSDITAEIISRFVAPSEARQFITSIERQAAR